jgi:hypothetical protein
VSVLAQARKAVFGETWALPIGVAVLVGGAALLKQVASGAWPDIGGPLLVAGGAVLLAVLVSSSARST